MKRNKVILKTAGYFFLSLLFFFSLLLFLSSNWIGKHFSFSNFEEVIFTITSPVLNAGQGLVSSFIDYNVIPSLIGVLILIIYLIIKKYRDIIIKLKVFNKSLEINLCSKLATHFSIIVIIGFFIFSFVKFGNRVYFFDYVYSYLHSSMFIEENYVNPKDVKLVFPETKKNLIYIFLESMESTYINQLDIDYIPELSKVASSNINFSNDDGIGGAHQVYGVGWTIAGMVAQTSGVPLKSPFSGNILGNYYDSIVGGTLSIGEILKNNGYNNYLMIGSDASFGSRDLYFENHGDYEIFDYYSAIEDEIIDEDYYVFWGYEDDKLFSYAKKKLKEISKSDTPFNFTMLTVDTHANDGYMDESCEYKYDNQYLNSVSCSSIKVNKFINWIKKQDFYDNTVIIISGDHLSMNNYSFSNFDDEYDRTIYNAFLNVSLSSDFIKEREFYTMDMFPTTLAALGVEIKGNRLGLGTNLFSGDETLLEKYGYDYVNTELSKNSKFYNEYIMR